MTELEKVVKGLESLRDICNAKADMAVGEGRTVWAGYASVVYCALALLREQVPRVMTQEELAAAQKTPVWRETKSKHKDLYNGWMLAYEIQRGQGIMGQRQGMTEPNGRVGWGCKLDDYGKTWRCWTSHPTDEQREAVKWDE